MPVATDSYSKAFVERAFRAACAPIWPNLTRREKPLDYMHLAEQRRARPRWGMCYMNGDMSAEPIPWPFRYDGSSRHGEEGERETIAHLRACGAPVFWREGDV